MLLWVRSPHKVKLSGERIFMTVMTPVNIPFTVNTVIVLSVPYYLSYLIREDGSVKVFKDKYSPKYPFPY